MVYVIRVAWPLLLGMALLLVGNSLQGSLIGVRGKLEAFDASTMGLVMACYFAGFLGGSMLTPVLLARVGHVRVFAALGSLISAAFILYASLVHPIAWALLRFVVGLGFSGLYVVAESWLNDIADNEKRGQTLSVYMIVQMLGVIGGQALLNVGDPAGYDLFVLISVVVSLSIAPILLSVNPAPVYQTAQRMTFRELFQTSPLGCVGMLALGGVFSAQFGMSAVYAGEAGFSVAQTSMFVSAIFIGGLALQYPIGWLSDRIDRRSLIAACFLVAAAACALGTIFADIWPVQLAVMFVLGGTSNPLYGVLIAYTNDYVSRDRMASVSGGLIFINGVGATVGPLLVGEAMGRFGPSAYFAFIFFLTLGAFFYALYRMTQRVRNIEEMTPFVPLTSRATAVAAEIAADHAAEVMEEAATEEAAPAMESTEQQTFSTQNPLASAR